MSPIDRERAERYAKDAALATTGDPKQEPADEPSRGTARVPRLTGLAPGVPHHVNVNGGPTQKMEPSDPSAVPHAHMDES